MIPLGHLPFFGGKPLLPPPSLCFELTRNNFIFVATYLEIIALGLVSVSIRISTAVLAITRQLHKEIDDLLIITQF